VEAVELVQLAMDRLGAEGPTELADALKLPGRHAPQRIARWLKGPNEPDYETKQRTNDNSGNRRSASAIESGILVPGTPKIRHS
jgi:hypothetical protein